MLENKTPKCFVVIYLKLLLYIKLDLNPKVERSFSMEEFFGTLLEYCFNDSAIVGVKSVTNLFLLLFWCRSFNNNLP